MGPSEIGNRVGFEHHMASASVARQLKYLVEKGLVLKIEINKRVVLYECVQPQPPFRLMSKPEEEAAMLEEFML